MGNMQLIKQDTRIDEDNLNKLLGEYGIKQVGLNAQAISDDIALLNVRASETKNKTYSANCWKIIRYLAKLNKIAMNNELIDIDFKCKDGIIKSEQVAVRKLHDFGIQTTDYFVLKDRAVILLDYSRLMDGLAVELGHIDLGYEDAEGILEDVGIVATYEPEDLGEMYEEGLYRELYNLRIGDSDYLTPDGKNVHDYYGGKIRDRISYIGVLDSTTRKTMSIMANAILDVASTQDIEIELAAVYEDSLVIAVPDGDNVSEIGNTLAVTAVARILGRKFAFKPEIVLY